jgi:type I restriction enzyme S subunit
MTLSKNLSGCQVVHVDALPASWECEPLGNRIELQYGRALREEQRRPGDTVVYGSNGPVGTHNVRWLEPSGILVGRKGSVGSIHFATAPYWPIDTVYYVRALKPDAFRYLYHLLDYLPLRFLNAATGVPGLSRRDAYALRGVFPPKPEQERIVSALDTVDKAIASTEAALGAAKDLAASLVTNAIDKARAPSKRLREYVADVRYGTSQASNDRGWGHPTLRIPNVVGDQLSLSDVTYVDLRAVDVARLQLRDGDLLLVRTNGNPGYVGRSAVFRAPDARQWVYASYLIRVRLKPGLLPEYVNIYLGTERGRRELLRRVTTSAGNHNINSNSIKLLSLPVPSSTEEQQHIVRVGTAARERCSSLLVCLAALEELKLGLRRVLFTGQTPALRATTEPIGAL